MRNFNHIILDFESHKSVNTSKYWATKAISNSSNLSLLNSVDLFAKFSKENNITTHPNLTINYSNELATYSRKVDTQHLTHLYSTKELSNVNLKDNNLYRSYIVSNGLNLNLINLEQSIALNLSLNRNSDNPTFSSSHNLVNVNFLRKERLYTKLKYSRSPAYDIVSGGAAAILAGFLGFLISEKYGFELVDSGDFYFLFMYLVFLSFSVRPLLITLNSSQPISTIFSIKPIIQYFLTLFYLVIKLFKK